MRDGSAIIPAIRGGEMIKCRQCGEEIICEELLAVEDELNVLERHWRRCHTGKFYRITRELDRAARLKLRALMDRD
jgi:hypothetical protein